MAAILRIVGPIGADGFGGKALETGAGRFQAVDVDWVVSGLAACFRG